MSWQSTPDINLDSSGVFNVTTGSMKVGYLKSNESAIWRRNDSLNRQKIKSPQISRRSKCGSFFHTRITSPKLFGGSETRVSHSCTHKSFLTWRAGERLDACLTTSAITLCAVEWPKRHWKHSELLIQRAWLTEYLLHTSIQQGTYRVLIRARNVVQETWYGD